MFNILQQIMEKSNSSKNKGNKKYSSSELIEIGNCPIDELNDSLQDPNVWSSMLNILGKNQRLRKK